MGGASVVAAYSGLHHQDRKSSVRGFVILTWDLLREERSPSNALMAHVFASDHGRTPELFSYL